MKLRSVAQLVFGLVIAAAAVAAPVARDLGEGLTYFRVHELPADLPDGDAKAGALIVDLRYVYAAPDPVATLQAWVRFHATAATPVVILINAATGAPLRDAIARLAGTPGLVSISSSPKAAPADLTVDPTADAEREAYDALDHGTTVETLITQNAGKPRHDEASLAQPDTTADDSADGDETGADAETGAPPPPPFDAALQRAFDVHRALLALGRLPARS